MKNTCILAFHPVFSYRPADVRGSTTTLGLITSFPAGKQKVCFIFASLV